MSTSTNWLGVLQQRIHTFAEAHTCSQELLTDLREFVMAIAREQYLHGNKSGIRWLRTQMQSQQPIA